MQTELDFLRKDMGSWALNRGLPVGRQSPERRDVSRESNIHEVSCQSLPLCSRISQNFNPELSTLEYPSEMHLTPQNLAYLHSPALISYWSLSKQDDMKEKGLDVPLCWEPHQRRIWKTIEPLGDIEEGFPLGQWQLHGVAQKIPRRLSLSNVPHRLWRNLHPGGSKIRAPVRHVMNK